MSLPAPVTSTLVPGGLAPNEPALVSSDCLLPSQEALSTVRRLRTSETQHSLSLVRLCGRPLWKATGSVLFSIWIRGCSEALVPTDCMVTWQEWSQRALTGLRTHHCWELPSALAST